MKRKELLILMAMLAVTVPWITGCEITENTLTEPEKATEAPAETTTVPEPSAEPAPVPADPIPEETVPEEEPLTVSLSLTREEFPRMNGSTSTVPLGKAIASALLGETREEVADFIQFSKTTMSYRQLLYGNTDILISAEPADVIWEEKNSNHFQWEMEPFAIDGLVFLVNANNPLDSLTTEQLQKIYTGEITNCKELGGEDLEIVPFQRNPEAGSQTAMNNLVMKDLPLMEAPAEYIIGDMGGLIKSVSSYDGTAAAIGYTVYYYANDMKMAEGLKLLAVDGIYPSDETIRSGEYPFLNNYYAVISADLSAEAPARQIYDWLLSEEGQRLVSREGYVSVLDVGTVNHPDHNAAKPLYTVFEPFSGDDSLLPREDYGNLLAYIGAAADIYEGWETTMLYGLVTDRGQLVTNPIYSRIHFSEDFLVLTRVNSDTNPMPYDSSVSNYRHTLAAPDGSRVKDLVGHWYINASAGLAATADSSGIHFWDRDGSELCFVPMEAFEEWIDKDEFHWGTDGGPFLMWNNCTQVYVTYFSESSEWRRGMLYLDLTTGAVSDTPLAGYPEEYSYPETELPAPELPDPYIPSGSVQDLVTGNTFYYAQNMTDGTCALFNAEGDFLSTDCELSEYGFSLPLMRAGMLAYSEDGMFCYRKIDDNTTIFRWRVQSNSD